MHEAPTIVGIGDGQIYIDLPFHKERLFSCFKLVTSRSKWSNLAIAPRLVLSFKMLYCCIIGVKLIEVSHVVKL